MSTQLPADIDPVALDAVRRQVTDLHAELLRWGLVTWTAGNVSAAVTRKSFHATSPSRRGISIGSFAGSTIVSGALASITVA